MRLVEKISILALLIAITGCRELPSYFKGAEPLAKVYGKTLYLHEVERLAPENITGDDSAAFYKLYVERWVTRQLKLNEAEQLFSSSEADIEAMVEEYRQSLLIRKLEQYYVDRSIDTLFSDSDISEYYNSHLSDFKSTRTWVKGRVLRFPDGARQSKKLLDLMRSPSSERQKDLEDICLKQGYAMDTFQTWTDYEEFLSYLPALRTQDNTSLVNSYDVQQMRDSHFRYYFQITACRRAGEAMPLEMVKETIRRILFKQRQSELLIEHEEELHERALLENKIKIYESGEEDSQEESSEAVK